MQYKSKQNERTALPQWHSVIMLFFTALILFQCGAPQSSQDTYPSKPLTLIVPWAAGGMTDLSSRMLGAVLQQTLGQPVNVINRTGGGGVVGHLAIANAKPDGYTIGAVTVDITLLHHMGLTDLTYGSYDPLSLTVNNASGITVRADAPWDSLPQLIEAIKAAPGKLQASGTARAGIWDLARMGFLNAAGLKVSDMPWVPSQGAAPALQELLAGGIDVVTASLTEVDALRRAGQVKCLGVMADERLAGFPDVPTLKEQGVDWSIGGWVSVCAPPGMDPVIRAKLDSAIQITMQDPQYIATITESGNNLQPINGEALKSFMADQDKVNGELLSLDKK